MIRIILGFLAFLAINSCSSGLSFAPKDLKSPCVAIESPDGKPSPCVRRSVNTHWLG